MSNLILAYDGDNAGSQVGRAILANDSQRLHDASDRIVHGHDIVTQWVEENGGQRISGGGDEGTFEIPEEALHGIEQLRKDYEFATNLTMSVGVGTDLAQAGKALLAAKFRGKNMVVRYGLDVEKEIQDAVQAIKDNRATPEQRKLGEQYLNANENTYNDQSEAARDVKQRELGMTPPTIDRPDMSKEPKIGVAHPMGTISEKDSVNNRRLDEDASQREEAVGQDRSMSPDSTDALAIDDGDQDTMEDHFDQSLDNEKEIISQNSPEEHSPGTPEQEEAIDQALEYERDYNQSIEPEDLVGEGEMEDNVSRPDDYDSDFPTDMGLSEEENEDDSPDLSDVLRDGLDNHADSIQKERVVSMVSQALEGFKANKDILERAKEKAPEMYESCIAMLRAMIEMAKMLGLGEEVPESPEAGLEEEPAQEEQASKQKPAAAPGGAAQSPQQ